MADMIREATTNPFRDWMDRHKMSIQRTADALGCSTGAVQNWKRNGAPRYILMACMAYSAGLPPLGEWLESKR